MKMFNNTERSRLKMVIYFGSLIGIITGYCAYIEMSEAVVIGLSSLAALVAKYTHDETKRPSK